MAGCNVLYRVFFRRWYPTDPSREVRVVRGDIESFGDGIGRPASALCDLTADGVEQIAAQVQRMVEAAAGDWPSYLAGCAVPSIEAVDAFDEYWNRERVAQVIKDSDPADFTNDYLILCCELGAVLGEVVCGLRPHAEWLFEHPYWDSAVWDARTGSRLNVFHWAIKKMSSYGVDDALHDKLMAAIGILDAEA